MSRASVLLGLATAACGAAAGDGNGVVVARVQYTPRDTVRFGSSASLRRCGGGRGFILEGEVRGNGVLVWLRPGDSLPQGRYPVLQRGDTSTPRGAVVAVRFMTAELAHGVVLDSGSVTVTVSGDSSAGRRRVAADVNGAGLETADARRVRVVAAFATPGPPPPSRSVADTVRCVARR